MGGPLGTDRYFEGYPFLTEESGVWLRTPGGRLSASIVAIIETLRTPRRPAHSKPFRLAVTGESRMITSPSHSPQVGASSR